MNKLITNIRIHSTAFYWRVAPPIKLAMTNPVVQGVAAIALAAAVLLILH